MILGQNVEECGCGQNDSRLYHLAICSQGLKKITRSFIMRGLLRDEIATWNLPSLAAAVWYNTSYFIRLLSYWSHNLSRTPSYCQWDRRLSAGTHKHGCVPRTVPQHSTWGPSKLECKHTLFWIIISGGFAEFRQTTISFVTTFCLSVCPSAWNNSAPTGRFLIKCEMWVFLENMSRKFKLP
jgi:hypothetical protein